MSAKTEGMLAVIGALIVLFSAMLDARISVIVSIAALLAFGVYSFTQKGKPTS